MIINYNLIPDSTMDSLKRYIEDGVPTGDFLRAVLSNDLFEACGRADDFNAAALWHIVAWIYNEAPRQCHGSPEAVDSWLERKQAESSTLTVGRDPE